MSQQASSGAECAKMLIGEAWRGSVWWYIMDEPIPGTAAYLKLRMTAQCSPRMLSELSHFYNITCDNILMFL